MTSLTAIATGALLSAIILLPVFFALHTLPGF